MSMCMPKRGIHILTVYAGNISMGLTNAELKAKIGLEHDKRFVDLSDGNGLVARWFKTGNISWYMRYRWQGKQVAFKLGNYPFMTIKEARTKCLGCRTMLDDGVDPRAEKKSRIGQHVEEQEMTLTKAMEYWFKEDLHRRRSNPDQVMRSIRKNVLPHIGGVPVTELTPQHWMKTFKKMAHAPVYAGTIMRDVKQGLKYCRVTGFCDTASLDLISTNDIGRMAKKRSRVLTRKELREVWDYCSSLDTGGNLKFKLFLIITMVTGCRTGELRLANKSDFDFETMVWTVPEHISKTGVEIKRPIPKRLKPHLVELMGLSPRDALLFPSPRLPGTPLANVNFPAATRNIIKSVDQEHWTPHVLRHTISTTFGDLELEPYVAEKMLGHSMAGVMAIYNKGHYLKQQAAAMETWIDYISTDRVFDDYV